MSELKNLLRGVEGVGEEVLYTVVTLTVVIGFCSYYCIRKQRLSQAVHPDHQGNVDSVRESMAGDMPHRRRFNHESACPVCLNEVQYEVETNCGHVFCCRCWVAYRSHGNFLGAVSCPVCRQQVTILFQCFSDGEMNPSAGSEEERQRDNLISEINSYNRRFSGQPRSLMDYLRDLPTISRHLWSEFFSYGGLLYMFRIRVVICMLVGVVYLLSPLDILPEAVYGILGLLDDVFVLLLVCIYISIIYRSYIAGRS